MWTATESQNRVVGNGVAGIADEAVWRDVQRATLAFLDRQRGEPGTTEVEAGGETFVLRADALEGVPGKERVLVVAVERQEPRFPSFRQLDDHFQLTRREAEVALLLAERKSDKEIAQTLGITIHTARRHTEMVFLKLGINRRTDVAATLARAKAPAARPAARSQAASWYAMERDRRFARYPTASAARQTHPVA